VNLRRASIIGWALLGLALLLAALGVCVGSAGFENLLGPLLNPLRDPEQYAMAHQIVWDIRLPRTLGAWAAGALLGLAGALAQGLFRTRWLTRFCSAALRVPHWAWRWRWPPWAVARARWAAR